MQESGEVVAMTGDAVNDAAALKQADIGVAMGSGSEVTKQAAKIVLTDDNFATLVRAVDLGRDIYRRISSYVKLQLTILSSVLQLMLLATILNINERRRAVPDAAAVLQVLRRRHRRDRVHRRRPRPGRHAAAAAQAGHEDRQPRRRSSAGSISGFLVAASALAVLAWGPDEPSTTEPSVSMTMAFAVVALSAVNIGLVMRREREAPWSSPVFPYLGWIILGWALTWAAVELDMLQRLLDTVSLTGGQWLVVIGLSLIAPAFVAIDKAVQLARQRTASRRAGGKTTAGRAVPVAA